MIKWLRHALILLAILIPIFGLVSLAWVFEMADVLRLQAEEMTSEKTSALMENSTSRLLIGSIASLLQNFAISVLCLFAAHQLAPFGASRDESK